MKKFLICISVLLALSSLVSCSKREDDTISLKEEVPLSLAPDVSWAVITSPYAAYKEATDWDSETKSYCRKGDILQVLGKSIDSSNNAWYKFEGGWVSGAVLTVYSNRYKAQKVAKTLEETTR